MRLFGITIPIRSDGTFDRKKQKALARRFTALQQKQQEIQVLKKGIDAVLASYLSASAGGCPVRC